MQSSVPQSKKPLNIAVIGSGIAGMAAAWLLCRNHHVTVFEKNNRLGGHTNTVFVDKKREKIPVDTGFIVYNEPNYPNFVELLKLLKIKTQSTEMSFSVSLDQGKFEYGSSNIDSFFGQRSNILKSDFWIMLNDIRKFFKDTNTFEKKKIENNSMTLGEFLTQNRYGTSFIERFILPMGAAIWSAKPDDIKDQPLDTFIKFFSSHALLQFKNQMQWRTIVGGSREYVQKITTPYADKIKLSNGVKEILRKTDGVMLSDIHGDKHFFDQIVIATHADEALTMLSDADNKETEILSAFKYNNSRILLHSDTSLMPRRKRVWSSWNFLGKNTHGVSVTYWMNLLQSIDNEVPYFVSVNPKFEPNPSLIYKSFSYQHPYFNIEAWDAQKKLWQLQGNRNTWFCGSYFGYGFHEDALEAGLAVAEELGGIKRPWETKGNSSRIYRHN